MKKTIVAIIIVGAVLAGCANPTPGATAIPPARVDMPWGLSLQQAQPCGRAG